MTLSIIVPVYNAEEYLNQCIESILKQSYRDIELMLVDNNSTDSSLSICREYEDIDKRVHVLKETKQGPFYARKRGVLEATGDYITFVDADDFIAENSYCMALPDMECGVDGIFYNIYRYFSGEYIRYDSSWKTEKIYDKGMIFEEIFPQMLWNKENNSFGIDPALWCKIIRADKIKSLFRRIDAMDFHYGEDVAIIYPLIRSIDFLSIHNEAYYYHRQRNNGELPGYIKDDEYLYKLYKLYLHLKSELPEHDIFDEQIDLFYINSINLARKKYGVVEKANKRYLFPFGKVEKHEKIIIYGAGNVGTQYMEQIIQTKYCHVTLWVDKYAVKQNVHPIEDISKYSFDKVVIAIEDKQIIDNVKRMLLEMDISDKKIVY